MNELKILFDIQEGSEDSGSDSDQNNQSDSDSKSDNANSAKSRNSSESDSDSKSEKSEASAAPQSRNSPKYHDSDDGKANVSVKNNAASSLSASSDRYVSWSVQMHENICPNWYLKVVLVMEGRFWDDFTVCMLD